MLIRFGCSSPPGRNPGPWARLACKFASMAAECCRPKRLVSVQGLGFRALGGFGA